MRNDQTFVSGPHHVRDHLSADEARQRLRHRFAIFNLWHPFGVIARTPLAPCYARTISPDNLVPSDPVYRGKVGEICSFIANPAHHGYHFPRRRPDEALQAKIQDSLDDGTAKLTAHTAFEGPRTPPDAPPRRSIELRALLL